MWSRVKRSARFLGQGEDTAHREGNASKRSALAAL
jgi:hypothetical protein